jgi:hypothetical protein
MSDSSKHTVRQVIENLRPVLEGMEKERLHAIAKHRKAQIFGLLAFFLLGSTAVILFLGSPENPVAAFVLGGAAILISVLTYSLLHGSARANYVRRFKTEAFSRVARAMAPGITYHPEDRVPRQDFERSRLFSSRIDRYQGEDCFSGKIGATDVLFSEIKVERKDTSTDSKGHTRTTWVTVFKGIYLTADFHKHFRCQVSIVPDIAEATFGWLGRKIQGLSSDLIRLENPNFERAFKVRASDPVEVRYLLTPDMQERLLAFRNKWSSQVRIALLDSRLHLAIPNNNNWFEPSVDRPATDTGQLGLFIEQLGSLLEIPELLDLNTRIWTKE